MSQIHDWQQSSDDPLPRELWVLAAELEDTPEARRRRREQKRQQLLAAGLLVAADDPAEAWVRHPDTISGPPRSYPKGVSPMTGGLHEGA